MIRFSVPLFFMITMATTAPAQNMEWVSKVGTKSFPESGKVYSVNRYGAKNDGKSLCTKAVQKAIDACAKKGGGIVTFNTGTYVMGAVYLKNNVHLKIDKGVLILGSENVNDFPDIDTRVAGIEIRWPSALINVIDATNVGVTGEGVINARGKFNWDLYWKTRKEYDEKGLRWIVDYDVKRVRTVLVQGSSDVTLKGLTFKNAGFWTVQLLYSKYITVDGIVIRNNEDGSGPSTDGVDVDSSSWILIENCDIDCNDDNFCLKAGRDWDGLRVNRPTEYVVIRKCIARRGAGLVTLGSETSGGIRHVLATDLIATHTDNGLRIKSATTRGGVIEDIRFQNSVMDSVNVAFQYNLNWYPAYSYSELPAGYTYETIPPHWKAMLHKVEPAEKGIPHAKDIFVDNVTVTHANSAFVATGLAEAPLKNFVYTNGSVEAATIGSFEFTEDWVFKDFKISVSKKAVPLKNTEGVENQERMK